MHSASLLSVIDILKVVILEDVFLITISKNIANRVFTISKLSNYV